MLARSGEDVVAGISVVAEIRAAGNVAGRAAERKGIEPELAGRVVAASIRNAVGTRRTAAEVQIAGALTHGEWEAGPDGNDSVGLPAAESEPQRTAHARARQLPDVVGHHVMGLVEAETAA